MAEQLKDKVILVTGGGSGIGRATSLALAAEGAKVVVCDQNQTGGEETVGFITQKGGQATFIKCNVTKKDEVQALIVLRLSVSAIWWAPAAIASEPVASGSVLRVRMMDQ